MLHYSFMGYLAASAIVLFLCWAVWRMFFEQNMAPAFSRTAILSIYALSLIVPLLATITPVVTGNPTAVAVADPELFEPVALDAAGPNPVDYASLFYTAATVIYLAGVAALLWVTCRSLLRLMQLKKGARRIESSRFRIFLHNDSSLSTFSWLRNIFLLSESAENNPDELEVLIDHETAHVDMFHWVDLLFAQAMVIFQWFNPAAWLLRRQLQRIHEYQADARVIANGTDPGSYQLILLKNISGSRFTGLTDGLNNCSLKQRIIMMRKTNRRGSTVIRSIAVMAVASGAAITLHQPAVASLLGTVQPVDKVNHEKVSVAVSTQDLKIDGADYKTMKWTIDGKDASAEDVKSLDPASIASVEINKTGDPQGKITLKKEKVYYGTMVPDAQATQDLVVVAYTGSKKEPAPQTKNSELSIKEVGGAYTSSDPMPEYPGGMTGLMGDLAKVTRFPESELKNDVDARVVVQFIVNSKGDIDNIKVVSSEGEAVDNAAVTAIKSLPGKWKPVAIDGKPVDVWFTIPIMFKTK